MLRNLLVGLIWIALCSVLAAAHPAICTTEVPRKDGSTISGGGVYIGNRLVLSCAHGLGDTFPVGIVAHCKFQRTGRRYEGYTVKSTNRDRVDLCLIELIHDPGIQGMPIAPERPPVGTPVQMQGYGGGRFRVVNGVVTGYERGNYGTFMQTSMRHISGDSGSAIMTMDGLLVSIVKGGNPYGGIGSDVVTMRNWGGRPLLSAIKSRICQPGGT